MSHVIHYQPVRYHHIKPESLYADPRIKRGTWEKIKERILQRADIVDAKMKTIFDKRLRASMWVRSVRQHLRGVGLTNFDLLKPETFSVAKLLREDEVILGAIAGRLDKGNSALIVVTDQRVLYLSQIPLFTEMDEMGYGIVDGVDAIEERLGTKVTLRTEIGDFTLYNVNSTAAHTFVDAIERAMIEHSFRD